MLPFLDKKKTVSVIMAKRGKGDVEVAPEVEAPESDIDPSLKAAGEDILRAIQDKSVIDLIKGLKDAFHAMEEAPHEEGPHIEEE